MARRIDFPVFLEGIGSVQAFNSVLVKSRVDGQIVKINFSEGTEVKAGDVLARSVAEGPSDQTTLRFLAALTAFHTLAALTAKTP